MKQVTILMIFVSVFVLNSCSTPGENPSAIAASSPIAATNKNLELELRNLHKEYMEASIKNDNTAFEKLMAADYIESYGSEKTRGKAEFLKDAKNDKSKLEMTFDDERIKIYGDTAVITFKVTYKKTDEKNVESGKMRYTNVWAKNNGNWQVVAEHGSRINEKPSAQPSKDSSNK